MDLKSLTDSVKAGTAIKSPIASLTGSLGSSISSIAGSSNPSIAALASQLQSLSTSAASAVSGVTSSLMTKLPLIKAADSIAAKLAASQGTLTSGPGDGFAKAFGPLTDAKTHLTNIQSMLTPAVIAQLQSGNTSALSSITSAVSSASSGISNSSSLSASAVTDQISNLKSYSFAKFSSMPQPPHVQALLDSVGIPSIPSETLRANASFTTSVSTSVATSERIPPAPTPAAIETRPVEPVSTSNPNSYISSCAVNLNPIGYGGSTPVTDFVADYLAYVQPLSDSCHADLEALNAEGKAANAWRDANIPNYEAIKAAAKADPNDASAAQAYADARARYRGEGGWAKYETDKTAYDTKRANVLRLRTQLDNWRINSFKDVTAGPPW